MKLPRNMCRVLPPIVARNPYLIEEFVRGRNLLAKDIGLAVRTALARASARVRAEWGILD